MLNNLKLSLSNFSYENLPIKILLNPYLKKKLKITFINYVTTQVVYIFDF